MKDVTDAQVCRAVAEYWATARSLSGDARFPYDILHAQTGEPIKVCFRAMERAAERGLIEYGVSLRTGWLTAEGQAVADG